MSTASKTKPKVKSVAVKVEVKAQPTAQENFDVRFLAWYVALTANGHTTGLWRKITRLFDYYSLLFPGATNCVKLALATPVMPVMPVDEPCQQRLVAKMVINNYDGYVELVKTSSHLAQYLPLSRAGYKEVDRVEICKKLMLELDDRKEKVDLLELRHTLFRLYQFILLACKCTNSHVRAIKSTGSVKLAESDALTHLLEYHNDLVKWMESVKPVKPTAEFILSEEKKNEMLTAMKMTKPFIFEDLFRVDLTFLSATQSPLSSTSSMIPTALLSIIGEYCRLDPLNPADEKLIAINLLKE